MSDIVLPHASVLTFEGSDAARFCQSQLMNDVNTLQLGDSQWTGWLSAKGRVIALGRLSRSAEQRYDWVLFDHPADALRPLLAKFVLRSKLSLTAREDLSVLGVWQALDSDIRLEYGRGLRLLPRVADGSPADSNSADADAWLAADFQLGLPRLPWPSGVEAYTPHMLSLQGLSAFSTRKGCYPGQEIVARTHFLGASKRWLAAFRGHGLREGDLLHGDEGAQREVGRVLRHTSDGAHAQAVMSAESERVFHQGTPLQPWPNVKNGETA